MSFNWSQSNNTFSFDLKKKQNKLEKKTMEEAPQGFIHQVSTLHQKIDVYSYRYFIKSKNNKAKTNPERIPINRLPKVI